jgi:plastocyanin
VRKAFAIVAVASGLLLLLAAPASAATTTVHIVGGAPNPAEVTIDEGDMVTFVNDDDIEHRIFAAGQPRGDPIAPHTSADFGPFQTGGQKGTFTYQVDQNGSAGTIFVRGPAPSTTPSTTPTTRPTTTTAQPTTTATSTTVATTTSTTLATTTSASSTTTTLLAVQSDSKKKGSSNVLAVVGFALLFAGVGGLIVAVGRSRQRRRSS